MVHIYFILLRLTIYIVSYHLKIINNISFEKCFDI
jgi:hypothetical protein